MKKEAEGVKLNNLPELKAFRKKLRNQLTPAEAKLWTHLKAKKLDGRKFRRQHSIGPFILDFYCPSEHLAVELDGQGHLFTRDYDRQRDLFLEYFDILVLRFENKFVFECPGYVTNHIKEHFGWMGENHPGLNSSPPAKGEYPEGGRGLSIKIRDSKKQPPRPSATPPSKGGEL